MSVANVSLLEGSSGTTNARVQVTLSHPSGYSVGVNYTALPTWEYARVGMAERSDNVWGKPADFAVTSGSIVIPPNRVSATISVPIVADTTPERDEPFYVQLTNPWASVLGEPFATVTIIDDDTEPNGPSGFGLGIGDASIREGSARSRVVELPVNFTGPAPQSFSITTATTAVTATGGTGGDFASRIRTQSVAAGSRFKTVKVTLRSDAAPEATETFTVTLSTTFGTLRRSVATVTIRDDDMVVDRPGRRPGPPRVALIGDSIMAQTANVAKPMLEAAGYAVIVDTRPGQGLLDADWCLGQKAALARDNFDPDFVVFEHVGNYGIFPPCDPGVAVNTPEFFAGWSASAALHTSMFTNDGATVWWIINPQIQPGGMFDRIAGINIVYSELVASEPAVEGIDLYTAFGGDASGCTGRAPDCIHLDATGAQMFAAAVAAALPNP